MGTRTIQYPLTSGKISPKKIRDAVTAASASRAKRTWREAKVAGLGKLKMSRTMSSSEIASLLAEQLEITPKQANQLYHNAAIRAYKTSRNRFALKRGGKTFQFAAKRA